MKILPLAISALILSYQPFYDDSLTCFRDCEVTTMGRGFIERNEGEVDYVYKDVAGNDSICFGHKLLPGEHFGLLTSDQCGELLKRDLQPAQATVNWRVNRPLRLNEADSICDLIYNQGTKQMDKFFGLVNKNQEPDFMNFDHVRIHGEEKVDSSIAGRRARDLALYTLKQ